MKFRLFSAVVLMAVIATFGCQPTATESVQNDIESEVEFEADFNPQGLEVGSKVGMLAPEIVGEDLDGVAFQLSDYRGKVVMLDFYGDW